MKIIDLQLDEEPYCTSMDTFFPGVPLKNMLLICAHTWKNTTGSCVHSHFCDRLASRFGSLLQLETSPSSLTRELHPKYTLETCALLLSNPSNRSYYLPQSSYEKTVPLRKHQNNAHTENPLCLFEVMCRLSVSIGCSFVFYVQKHKQNFKKWKNHRTAVCLILIFTALPSRPSIIFLYVVFLHKKMLAHQKKKHIIF